MFCHIKVSSDPYVVHNALTANSETFFERFRLPTLKRDDEAATTAIMHFYEPFLEAFDPVLRKELGVWYTPVAVVRYQVATVDRLLREELGCERGFAEDHVVVLDPCCGTGAYLVEALRHVAAQLESEGAGATLGARLLETVCKRFVGFEILTAPFVVAQLQLYLMLARAGAAPDESHRPAIFLTNALTGWQGPAQLKLNFPELQEEHDAAQDVKKRAKIIVVLGNPPYNRYAGVPLEEEGSLVDHYKGIQRDQEGRQVGQSELFTRWGIRKQLLDDLYVRFLRLAEVRIGEKAEFGVVSYISNSSFLTGRSHPLMRASLVHSFQQLLVDNLNGDKYKTGKVVPKGVPGEGTSDQSIFSTEHDPRGIQVGTCITTYLKRPKGKRKQGSVARVHYRDFWGRAADKRNALLASLEMASWKSQERAKAAATPQGPRDYAEIKPSTANRWIFAPQGVGAGYEDWPALDELFVEKFMGVHTGKDGGVVAFSREELLERFKAYLDKGVTDAKMEALCPVLMKVANEFDDPRAFRRAVQKDDNAHDPGQQAKSYLYRPLDHRMIWYDTARRVFGEGKKRWAGCLVQRYGEEFKVAVGLANEFLVTVPEPRRVTETRPLIAKGLVDLHVHDRGSVCIPAEVPPSPGVGSLFEWNGKTKTVPKANMAEGVWRALQKTWGLNGDLDGAEAKAVTRDLFRLCVAVCHAPQYESEHKDSLAHDWAHVPIPRARSEFMELVRLGAQVATLLEPSTSPAAAIKEILGDDAKRLGVDQRVGGGSVKEVDLEVTYSYFAAAKGKWEGRALDDGEPMRQQWGEDTGDLFLNERVVLKHVPLVVWKYELGGYPVVKKWLGYRDAGRRPGAPLTLKELALM